LWFTNNPIGTTPALCGFATLPTGLVTGVIIGVIIVIK